MPHILLDQDVENAMNSYKLTRIDAIDAGTKAETRLSIGGQFNNIQAQNVQAAMSDYEALLEDHAGTFNDMTEAMATAKTAVVNAMGGGDD